MSPKIVLALLICACVVLGFANADLLGRFHSSHSILPKGNCLGMPSQPDYIRRF